MDGKTEPAGIPRVPVPIQSVLPTGTGSLLDGRYRLLELLGRGATAEVYQGVDELLRRPIAVKVFNIELTDLNTVVRQRREMQVLAALSHPNLVAVYDARIADDPSGTDGALPVQGPGSGHTYLVLELVRGHTLAQQLTRGRLPPETVAQLGRALASALTTVHGAALVHRDIKPANILMADTGAVKLGDFGLARILTAENRLTTSAAMMGTAAYFSPEQARGYDVGPAADIYALGLVLLECLTGQREFPGDAVPAAVARLLRDPAIPADLPRPWPPLLAGMTAPDPASRPTAIEVADTLAGARPDAFLRPAAHTAALPAAELNTAVLAGPHDLPIPNRPTRTDRRRRNLVAGVGTLLILGAATAVLAAHPGADAPSNSPRAVIAPPPSTSPVSGPTTTSPHTGVSAGTSMVPNSPTTGAARSMPSASRATLLHASTIAPAPNRTSATTATTAIQANTDNNNNSNNNNNNGGGNGSGNGKANKHRKK